MPAYDLARAFRLAEGVEWGDDPNMRVTTRSDVQCTRHPGDVVRLGMGSIAVAGCSLIAATTRVTSFETALFRLLMFLLLLSEIVSVAEPRHSSCLFFASASSTTSVPTFVT